MVMYYEEKRSVLRHELKKLILPVILMLFFSYQIFVFYSIANITEDYACDLKYTFNEINSIRDKNESDLFNKLAIDFKESLNEYQEKIKVSGFSQTIFLISEKINPYFPYSCELLYGDFCRYYISEETFKCMFLYENSETDSLFSFPEYRSVSFYLLSFHLLIIFIIGYFISVVFLFIFRNIKIKKTLKPSNITIGD